MNRKTKKLGIRCRNKQKPFVLGNLRTVPLWALLTDLNFLERKLLVATPRKRKGILPHKRYPKTYESNLKTRIARKSAYIEVSLVLVF